MQENNLNSFRSLISSLISSLTPVLVLLMLFLGLSLLSYKEVKITSEKAGSELGFTSLSPKGEEGGSSLPASCESGYTSHVANDCTIAFSATPPAVTSGSGNGTTLNWSFRNLWHTADGYSQNTFGYGYFQSPYYCTLIGPNVGGAGINSRTYYFPNSVAGSLATPAITANSTYSVTCRATGTGYPAAGSYFDYSAGPVTVQVVPPPQIIRFYTVPAVIFAGNTIPQTPSLNWELGAGVTSCSAITATGPAVIPQWPPTPSGAVSLTGALGPLRAYRNVNLDYAGDFTVTIQCQNAAGQTVSQTGSFTVYPNPAPLILSFTANPSVIVPGELTTLTWNSIYTGKCYEAGSNKVHTLYRSPSSGDIDAILYFTNRLNGVTHNSPSGSQRVLGIDSPTTFRIACFRLSDYTHLTPVTNGQTGLPAEPVIGSVFVDVKGITLTASPSTFPTAGANSSTLTWTINAAREQSCVATSNPSIPLWNNANLPISNSSLIVNNISATTDFTITCQKTVAAGGGSESVTAQVLVGLPVVQNFNYLPFPTALRWPTKPDGLSFRVSSNTFRALIKINEINMYFGPLNSFINGTLSPSAVNTAGGGWWNSQDGTGVPGGQQVYGVYGINNVFWGMIPRPIEKTTYTFTMTPYDSSWNAGTPTVTTVDVYPANPVTIREASSHANGVNFGSIKTLPFNDPTQNINVQIFARENGGYPVTAPGVIGSPTASFKFDAGPQARECYITRNGVLVHTVSNPLPTGNLYTPTVFTPPTVAESITDPGITSTTFTVACYYTDSSVLSSRNSVIFTYPPYVNPVTASCTLSGNTSSLKIDFTVPTGYAGGFVRAAARPGDVMGACAPTTTPQNAPGGTICATVVGTGNQSYTLTPAQTDRYYGYWVQARDSAGNWGDLSPFNSANDSAIRVYCPGPPNLPPVAILNTPVAPLNKTPTEPVTFTFYGNDPDVGDTIIEYYIGYGNTVIGSATASNTTVSGGEPAYTVTASLPAGVYTQGNFATGIRVLVKDSKGDWSPAVYVPTITVSYLPISVALTANGSLGPVSVAPGSTVNLVWTVTGSTPTSCTATIDNADTGSTWPGAKAPGGGNQPTIQPNFNQTYRISCTDGTRTGIASVQVNYTFKKNDGKCEGNKGENVINSSLDCKAGKVIEVIQ